MLGCDVFVELNIEGLAGLNNPDVLVWLFTAGLIPPNPPKNFKN